MSQEMAQKIKELRAAKGLTLEQVASAVGVGKSTVRKWETGMIANMKRDKIAALSNVLGVQPSYLLGWEEKSPGELPLTEGEKALLDLFRKVPEDKQTMVIQMIRAALETK